MQSLEKKSKASQQNKIKIPDPKNFHDIYFGQTEILDKHVEEDNQFLITWIKTYEVEKKSTIFQETEVEPKKMIL